MSAIFGFVHMDGQPASVENLLAMSAAMEVYGTDGGGVWHHESVGLGQRLMRFTPHDLYDIQPLINRTGLNTIVTDGRIDNRSELAHELSLSGRDLKQMPDSALILGAYDKWGVDCLSHLVGSFAFAIWNQREKALFVACSPMGERPLYYCFSRNMLAFASMPKGLFALPTVQREIDSSYLADYLTDAYIDPGRSWYDGLQRLPFGQALLITPVGKKIWQYWQPEKLPDIRFKRDEDYVDAFGALLEKVVAEQCISLTPVGVMLSGGLDSSTVAAIAAGQLQADNKALYSFTEVPPRGFDAGVVTGRYADESPFVLELADRYKNLQPSFIRAEEHHFLEGAADFFEVAQVPFRNSSNKGWLDAIHMAAKDNNIRVLLTGTQGNLTISWNGRSLLSELIRTGRILRAIHEAGNISRQNPGRSLMRVLIGRGVLPLLPRRLAEGLNSLRDPGQYFKSFGRSPWESYSPVRAAFAKKMRVMERADSVGWRFHSALNADSRSLRLMMFGLSSVIAEYAAAYRAAYGVESRDVPVDSRLVEFSMSIPEEQWLHRGIDRSLLRRTMQDRLPESIVHNNMRGLQAAGWLKTLQAATHSINSELDRIASSPFARDVLDVERLRRLAATLPQDKNSPMQQIMDYRNVLQKGLMVGRFLCWFETGK